jgi:hypothetical protein
MTTPAETATKTKTEYHPTKLNISKAQADHILNGMKDKKNLVVRLGSDSLDPNGNVMLPLTKAQHTKIQKHKNKSIGTDLKISKAQLRKIRSGGYMPLITGLSMPGLAPHIPKGTGDLGDTLAATLGESNPVVVEGEGVVDTLKSVGKTGLKVAKAIAKPVTKFAVRSACDLAANSAFVAAGVENPLAIAAADQACAAAANAVVGGKLKKPAAKKSGKGKPAPKKKK